MKLKLLVLICISTIATTAFSKVDNKQLLTVTSFNIKFFGLGGTMNGTPQLESRDPFLKSFLNQNVPKSDIIVFQEIVDVDRLILKVIGPTYNCQSYDSSNIKHQHILICVKSTFRLVKEPSDNNNLIDDVSIDGIQKSRPAVHTLIADKQGNILARIIGVHLKAYPSESKTRQEQIGKIAKFINNLPIKSRHIPIILTGDFNSYSANDTNFNFDDDILFSNIFKSLQVDLSEALNKYDYTFRSPSSRGKFDRFWISSKVLQIESVKVTGPCNDNKGDSNDIDADFFYKNISDHCPVTLKLEL